MGIETIWIKKERKKSWRILFAIQNRLTWRSLEGGWGKWEGKAPEFYETNVTGLHSNVGVQQGLHLRPPVGWTWTCTWTCLVCTCRRDIREYTEPFRLETVTEPACYTTISCQSSWCDPLYGVLYLWCVQCRARTIRKSFDASAIDDTIRVYARSLQLTDVITFIIYRPIEAHLTWFMFIELKELIYTKETW